MQQPSLNLIQDYRHLSERMLKKYHQQHQNEIDYCYRTGSDPSGIVTNEYHILAIKFVAKERGIELGG